ncbi:MAG TPA: hypothetical protein RMH26_07310, partial [Polyangiaceae bacterium LLY-WYZ-15_(1-7)]|nr:hypothetical protein [Polyangiaceae bacterium LLY-WYZ-15_(1-7)]
MTLSHEFGHLLHYFTTYVGLRDLEYRAAMHQVLATEAGGRSPEEHRTEQARDVLALARAQQRLTIDDEYYYEMRWRIVDEAAQRDGRGWMWSETTGGLFSVDGTLSDQRFWGLRFYLDGREDDRSFARIPIGLRTILEHLAAATDLIGEQGARDQQGFVEYVRQAVRAAHDDAILLRPAVQPPEDPDDHAPAPSRNEAESKSANSEESTAPLHATAEGEAPTEAPEKPPTRD